VVISGSHEQKVTIMRLKMMTAGAALAVATSGVAIALATAPASARAIPPGDVALNTQGALAFGSNSSGQLGDGTNVSRTSPVEPLGLGTGVQQVTAGHRHTLALRGNGTVYAWGLNADGQLGDGTHDTFFVPRPVPALTKITQVSAGRAHSLALSADGTVWAWGDNSHGQVGDGTVTDRLTPVPVSGLTGVEQIAAGDEYSLALGRDGRVMAWGENSDGQLGDGSLVDRKSPVRAFGLTGVIQIAAGRTHSLALGSDGRAYSWGSNEHGALGDGTFVDHVVPVQVPLLTNVAQVAAGGFFSLFLINGGVVQWGQDFVCNFGDGGDRDVDLDTSCDPPRSALFLAVELRGVTQIGAGGRLGAAIRGDGTLWSWDAEPVQDRVQPLLIQGAANAVQVEVGDAHTAIVVDRPLVNAP
jgi:alpha-tubulin suppressor-like RCC1 family protein